MSAADRVRFARLAVDLLGSVSGRLSSNARRSGHMYPALGEPSKSPCHAAERLDRMSAETRMRQRPIFGRQEPTRAQSREVPELQRLRPDHASAVLDFELANRAYCAASISDRGDEYYEYFTERYQALLTEQQAGVGAYHVLVAEDGSVLGRFNLHFVADGSAELGYRARRTRPDEVWPPRPSMSCADWHRHSTASAESERLRSIQNVASQKVLTKAGFLPVGPAAPADLGGKPGTWYERVLADE